MSNARIALVYSAVNMRRFTPGLKPFVASNIDFRYIDIYRPITEIFFQLKNWNPDGIITEELPGITTALLSLEKPTIISPSELNGDFYHGVNVDDFLIGTSIAEEFLRCGFENLACYALNAPFSRRRFNGFSTRLKKEKIEIHVREEQTFGLRQYLEYSSAINNEMQNWLQQIPKPAGVFATHDPLGRSLAEACKEFSYAIPEDISIISANDDDMVCGLTNPPLSSIKIPWNLLAQKSMTILLEMIAEKRNTREKPTIIPPLDIVLRQSSDIMRIDDQHIAKAFQYIRTFAHQDIHVPDIAKFAGISRRLLEQKFKKILGRTPRDEILRIRANKAKDLLMNTTASMSQIAEQCGFGEQERLSVNFKKIFGASPRDYRKKFRE